MRNRTIAVAALLAATMTAPCPAADEAPHRGVFEVVLTTPAPLADPHFAPRLRVAFARPDGSSATVDGFYDGDSDGAAVFKARAYGDAPGRWSWRSSSAIDGLDGRSGAFEVVPSDLKGKLRKHPDDPRQFAFDDGSWSLQIGDTGYRFVVDAEPEWQAYIDQADRMGATKIRTWFCRSRSGVEALFNPGRDGLALPYWQEIDRRIRYVLDNHPGLILQLIPFGEDTAELLRYGRGDRMALLVARYAQARFGAYPNVIWCFSNDRDLVADGAKLGQRSVPASVIDQIGRDMADREAWGTLLTNHQKRFSGYEFAAAPWSDIVTLEDLDQIDGAILLDYRAKADDPVVNDEDRYELYKPPAHPRYFFRRLIWSSLLSGGHATYGGLMTYEPYNGREKGVRGYFDAKAEGLLVGGADDFPHIHAFFRDAGLTLVGLRPADDLAGDDPRHAKVIAGDRVIIAYLPNPDSPTPEAADAEGSPASCRLRVPPGDWSVRWFDPRTGRWEDGPTLEANRPDEPVALRAPFAGDALALIRRN